MHVRLYVHVRLTNAVERDCCLSIKRFAHCRYCVKVNIMLSSFMPGSRPQPVGSDQLFIALNLECLSSSCSDNNLVVCPDCASRGEGKFTYISQHASTCLMYVCVRVCVHVHVHAYAF